jgi:hypothetical protein
MRASFVFLAVVLVALAGLGCSGSHVGGDDDGGIDSGRGGDSGGGGRDTGGAEDDAAATGDDGGATGDDSGTIVGDDSGTIGDDAAIDPCLAILCAPGTTCCPFDGTCQPDGCLACCRPGRADAGTTTSRDSGTTASRDSGTTTSRDSGASTGTDSGAGRDCRATGCPMRLTCCPSTGVCYDPACLACCMPAP